MSNNIERIISGSLTGIAMNEAGVCAEIGIGPIDAHYGLTLGNRLIALGERIIAKSAARLAINEPPMKHA